MSFHDLLADLNGVTEGACMASLRNWAHHSDYVQSNHWYASFSTLVRKKVKHLFRVHNGATPKSKEPNFGWRHKLDYARRPGSLKGFEITDTSRKITPEGYDSCGTSFAQSGSITFTRTPIGHLEYETPCAAIRAAGCWNQRLS